MEIDKNEKSKKVIREHALLGGSNQPLATFLSLVGSFTDNSANKNQLYNLLFG